MKTEKLGKLYHRGMWQIPYRASNVLCADGKRRAARTAMSGDTFFSLPASVQVKGKTVSGFLTGIETDGQSDLRFHAFTYRKNGHLLEDQR